LFDFCERVDAQACNRATIESLVKAGAFDSLGARRAQLMAAIERAIQSGAAAAADRRSGQRGLFGEEEETPAAASTALPNVPEFPEKERLAMEKEVLGFYLTSHPLAEYESILRTYCSHMSVQLSKVEHRTEVLLGGMLAAIKFSHTKNPRPGSTNTKYAMWDLEDLEGIMRCIMWPEQFAEFGEQVKSDAIVAIKGAVDRRPGAEEVNLIVNELIPIADLPARYTSGISIRVREEEHGVAALEKLCEILRGYPGTKPVKMHLALADGSSLAFDCPKYSVAIDPELRRRVEDLLGEANFKFIPTAQRSAPPPPQNGRRPAMARG
jgi:DNA polymerase-3 subunit alpha